MGLDDLAMMANPPVTPVDDKATDHGLQAEIDKAAAGETMPPPKEECEDCEENRAERVARRGQDPPDPNEA